MSVKCTNAFNFVLQMRPGQAFNNFPFRIKALKRNQVALGIVLGLFICAFVAYGIFQYMYPDKTGNISPSQIL